MNTIHYVAKIGRITANVASESDEGKLWDTVININGECLCWVSGQEIDQFLKEINAVIEKYAI